MSVNSITGNETAIILQSLNAAGALDKSAKGTPSTKDQSSNQTAQTDTVDVKSKSTIPPTIIDTQESSSEGDKKPIRPISHLVQSYNQHGELRTKFLDSNNNVIYQIPPEMVTKLEDLMIELNTSTDIKA